MLLADTLPPKVSNVRIKSLTARFWNVARLLCWGRLHHGGTEAKWKRGRSRKPREAIVWWAEGGNFRGEGQEKGSQASLKRSIKHVPERLSAEKSLYQTRQPGVSSGKMRDCEQKLRASECQVYQIELQTAPGSASKGYRHKSKSNLPASAACSSRFSVLLQGLAGRE